MPTLLISIRDGNLARALDGIRDRLTHLEPAYQDMGEYMLRRIDQAFRTETDPATGQKWAPLSRRYKKRKRGPKILTEGGRLRSSINYRPASKGFQIGANVPYAAIHQFGGDIVRKAGEQVLVFDKNGRFMSHKQAAKLKEPPKWAIARQGERLIVLPARPFLGASDEDVGRLARILRRYVLGAGL